MKNTYDQKDFIFSIFDGKTTLQFDYVYGLDCEDTWRSLQFNPNCEGFQLKACKNFSDAHINREKVSTTFQIPFCMDTTFEEATQAYLMEHLSEFRGNKLRFALCFLERYCKEYQEVHDIYLDSKRKKLVK